MFTKERSMKDRFLIIARDLGTIAMMIIIILSFSSSFLEKLLNEVLHYHLGRISSHLKDKRWDYLTFI